MPDKKEYLINLIFSKLKTNHRKINLEKKEFAKFIDLMINNN